ncbi:oxidoreductase domain protein [Coriobacterium glomerans PW2]|uniref:Oxidoreductase domain protein n=1 Tax=Coriobacterium glomerans (strain ATCC 49209 / DSM 20642 / JCM 10262 / PW2) TaxID=700015 RepID=F2N8K7_CORGP|nr:Gfo/Idh/MocA family oxidoreductase [Coriobacterium glomerans]AEB07390.1 oxidoreductase domain protein [Coriobacterium glomerans PW2]
MLRIATIGTSMITDNFVEALNANRRAVFVGTLSRDPARAEAFTRQRGGSVAFSSIGELADSAEVDAVYIASPNALHCEQALRCIEGGKHVLVEKPLGSNLREASAVFNAAERAATVAMEAMRPLHDPAYRTCRDTISQLGPVRRVSIRFGKYSSRYDEILAGRPSAIFDCEMAAGALMDIGVYCVEPMIDLLGEPQEITCVPVLLDPATRDITHGPIDGAGVIIARYPGAVAELGYSKITNDLVDSQIEGELATLRIDKISSPQRARLNVRGRALRGDAKQVHEEVGASQRELALASCANTMRYELDDFIDAVADTARGAAFATATAGGAGTLGRCRDITTSSIAVMDEARRQAGIAFPRDRR